MSLAYHAQIRCAVCGCSSSVTRGESYLQQGVSDLDTRPPEFYRSTINTWVSYCPGCHYCAADLEQPTPLAKQIMATPEYTRQLAMFDIPEKARHFLCHGLLAKGQGNLADAAWACIHAAWVCDDEQNPAASNCRRLALQLMANHEAEGGCIADTPETHRAIKVDLLRRTGQFDQARGIIDDALQGSSRAHPVLDLLRYQLKLIERGDCECHRVDEVSFSGPMTCSTCGHNLDSLSRHCPYCGHLIASS